MPVIPGTRYKIDDNVMFEAISYCLRAQESRDKRESRSEKPYAPLWDQTRSSKKYGVDVHVLRLHLKRIASMQTDEEIQMDIPDNRSDKEMKIEELNDTLEEIWKQLYQLKMRIRQWL